MIITTTNCVEGKQVVEYLGVVAGETVAGVNAIKDIAAGFRNFIGGRSQSYEGEFINARQSALEELSQRAAELGADAVIGVHLDYSALGVDNSMLMVTAAGTAVRLA